VILIGLGLLPSKLMIDSTICLETFSSFFLILLAIFYLVIFLDFVPLEPESVNMSSGIDLSEIDCSSVSSAAGYSALPALIISTLRLRRL
jgi:hypothetical protein